jgi:hypothetical protein
VKRELSPASRLPLFALAVAIAAVVVALLLMLDPASHQAQRARPAGAPPSAVVYGSPSPLSAPAPRAAPAAVAVGRRFLRLYARLQSRPLGSSAAAQLHSLASLALARTLLAQPPLPAGGGRARASRVATRPERLSPSAVLLHAALRHAGALVQVRCLIQRDRSRWTVTALTAAA